MPNEIYLDYNATTPIDKDVIDEMLPYIQNWYGNPSSSHSYGIKAQEAVQLARETVAHLIRANADEIVFTSGGTEANNIAIKGIAFANKEKGKHIITSAIEHPAVIKVCEHLENLGWEVTYVPVNKFGTVKSNDIEKAIRKDTTLISIMHANNEVGTIQPIEEIGAIAKKYSIAFHTDAAQALGKIETDVKKMGVDLLSIAGHKIYAPKGIGALYIKKGTKIEKLMHGASQENGLRAGTENVPYIVALGKACEIAQHKFEENTQNMFTAKNRLIEGLKDELKHIVHVNGDQDNCLPNTLSVAFLGVESHALASAISSQIFISTGSACHNSLKEASSVLQAMHVNLKVAKGTVRLSTGKHTTISEIDEAIETIIEAVNKLLL